MIPKPLREFMSRLLAATNNNEIKWKAGAEEAFFASQKDANIHLRYFFDQEDGESAFWFRLLRANNDVSFSVTHHEEDYAQMRDLYSAAALNAAGGEAIVSDLFD